MDIAKKGELKKNKGNLPFKKQQNLFFFVK